MLDRPLDIDSPSSIPSPIPMHEEGPRFGRDLVLMALAAVLLFFSALGARDLWNPNEPIYGRAVAEMSESGSWLIPTVNGKVFAEKPILYFWSALLVSKLRGGVDELSLRVPSALAGLASVLLVYLWVWPYLGRRRALLTVALFMTQYQVFWAARSVQMDILVLTSTLGVLLPLTRMLDFGLAPRRAWCLAGVAAGLGFAAKGPVALVLPGLVIFTEAILSRRLRILLRPAMLWGVAVAVVTSSPWYLALWFRGEKAFLYEVLIRQNFMRFVEAWDHVQPWWYFGKYLWLDYAPWSWLLPAAVFMKPREAGERRLTRLGWIWILAVIGFFSLSESKRAPYILPIAPAVAALAGLVCWRWMERRESLSTAVRVGAATAFVTLGGILLAAGVALWTPWSRVPATLLVEARLCGVLLAFFGALILSLTAVGGRPRRAVPWALYAAVFTLFLTAATVVLPAIDPLKSAREFAADLNRHIEETGFPIVAYGFWDWRAGYAYYADRTIPNIQERAELEDFWTRHDGAFVLVEAPDEREIQQWLTDAVLIEKAKIGSRTAFLFAQQSEATRLGSMTVTDSAAAISASR